MNPNWDTHPLVKAVGYIRVSTEDQALGPEAQRAALVRWAEACGAEIVAFHEDRGVSGAAALDKRPGLLAALDAVKAHRAGVLLVAKRDRLARDVVLAAMVERMAERLGARVTSADGTGDGDGPEALLMRRIVDAFGEYERAVIRARTRAALAAKRAQGKRAGQVPFGFTLCADGVTLAEDSAEQAVIRQIRALRDEGLSIRAVVAAVNEAAPPRRVHKSLVERVLSRAA